MRYRWKLINHIAKTELDLNRDPQGWKELRIKYYRSELYHGIFKEPGTKELGFFKNNGFEFLEAAFAADDINAHVTLLILKQKADGTYRRLTELKVNFTSRRKQRNVLFVNLEQSDLYQKLLSRDEISVNLQGTRSIGGATITAPTPKTIALPGMDIYLESQWTQEVNSAWSKISTPGLLYGGILMGEQIVTRADMDDTENRNYYNLVDNPAVDFVTAAIEPVFTFRESVLVASGQAFTYEYLLDGIFRLSISGPAGTAYDISGNITKRIAYGPDASGATEDDLFTIPFSANLGNVGTDPPIAISFNETGSNTFLVSDGDNVWTYWYIEYTLTQTNGTPASGTVNSSQDFNAGENWLKLWVNSQFEETSTKAYMIHEAFNQVVDAIADKDEAFVSELYGRTDSDKTTYPSNGAGSWLAITPGAAVRGFEVDGYVSLRDLFRSADALHNLSLGIYDNQVYVGQKSEAYINTRTLLLPNVKSFTTRTDATRYFNKIVLGYEKWEAEFKGGRDDPQTRHEYSTIVNSVNGQYEKLSKIIASTYALEATRRRSKVTYASEDWRFDNDNFWLALNDDYTMELLADAFSSPSGMVNVNTAYNLRLTPKRLLLAHFNMIVAGLQTIGGDITFVKAEGNAELEVSKTDIGNQEDYNGQPLAESASLAHNDSDVTNRTPWLLPEVYEFEYPLTEAMQDELEENPAGFIEFFENDGEHFFGYILEADTLLSTGLTNFKLIRKKI